jgi:hypothetical protein
VVYMWDIILISGLCLVSIAPYIFSNHFIVKRKTNFIPTPPATKITLSISSTAIPGGGQTKLPPTRTSKVAPRIFEGGCQSHAAGGLSLFWTASSRNGGWEDDGEASAGLHVRVKPPAFGRPGMRTSSHWNCYWTKWALDYGNGKRRVEILVEQSGVKFDKQSIMLNEEREASCRDMERLVHKSTSHSELR